MARLHFGASLVVTALLAACGGQTAPTSTTLSPSPTPTPTLTTVTVSGTAPAMGGTAEFTATAKFSDGTTQDVSSQATWQSSSTVVITVSNHGVVTAVGIGEVDVRATYQNVAGLLHVSVEPPTSPPPSDPAPNPPPPTNCSVLTISPTSQNFEENGPASGTISVNTAADCAWTASSNVSWVTLAGGNGARGIGNGTVSYSVAANLDTVGRSGMILIGSRAFMVTQDARPPCPATVSPTTFAIDGRTLGSFPVSGGQPLSITVTMSGICSWASTTDAPWLLIDSTGSGSGTLSVRVFQNNSGATRTGRISAAGQTVSVTQTACAFSLTPSSSTVGPSATNVSFTAQGNPGCLYNFNRTTDFLIVGFQSIGYAGTNTISVGVPQNPGTSQRSETLKMEGRDSDGGRTLVATSTITQTGS